MDAKVLRAAVSAAIRVTVSTTLIGCGGNVSTDAGRAASPAVQGTPANTGEPQTTDMGAKTGSPYPKPSAGGSATTTPTPSAGTTSGGAETGGMTSGGVETGGMASLAGAGGNEASAGAPGAMCDGAATACLATLEQSVQQPASAATKACCDTVLATLEQLPRGDAVCFADLDARFMQGGVRAECCTDPSTWVHPACTPWGPPVPPELGRDLLLAWSLAA